MLVLSALVACFAVAAGSPPVALAGELPCADAVLADWSDGAIDRSYAPDCYLGAIDALPEDVRTYTSAEEDITRALQSRTDRTLAGVASPATAAANAPDPGRAPDASRSLRVPPLPVLLLTGVGLALLAGTAVAAFRHPRRSR